MSLPASQAAISRAEAARELLRRRRARRSVIDFCRYTFPRYQASDVHHRIGDALDKVAAGEIKRLMIFVPPRTGKSELVMRFTGKFLGDNPSRSIITASYSHELATSFGRKVRDMIASQRFRALYPNVTLSDASHAAGRFHTNAGGQYLSAGVGSTMTGHGAHVLVIDDPIKDREQAESKKIRERVYNWYSSTAYTRLERDAEYIPDDPLWADPVSAVKRGELKPFSGAVVLVMTRWHKDDLAGRLLEDAKRGGDQWHVIKIPAVDEDWTESFYPEKYPLDELRRIHGVLTARDWQSLFMQEPPSTVGQFVTRDMITRGDVHEPVSACIGVDLASSLDDSADKTALVAAVRGLDGNVVFTHAIKGRWKFSEQKRKIIQFHDMVKSKYGVDPIVAVEHVAYQQVIVQELLEQTSINVIKSAATGSKTDRFMPAILRYEMGLIKHGPELPDWFDRDVIEFPDGERDAVDAAAHAFNNLPVSIDLGDAEQVGGRYSSVTGSSFGGW